MAGGSPSTPFWTTNAVASLPHTQGNLKDTQAGAVAATLSSPWTQSSSLETDSSLLAYQRTMQGAHLAAALSSRGPSPCNSPYHFPGAISQRPQLQTASVNHASSPIPITGRLQGPPTAPAYIGHRPTLSSSHGDLPVPSDWLSAGAQPLMLGAPWKNHEGGAAHQGHEGVSGAGTQNGGDPTLGTPDSATTAPLDLGPFEMDSVISNDPGSAAGAGASASTQERPGDLLPWGQTGAEQSYSQGAEQSLDHLAWLSKFLTTLDAQSLSTPASNHIAPSTSLPSENGSVHHPSPVSSPQQQDPDMVQRLYQANFHTTPFQLAVNGAHLPAPQDPMSVMMINPNHLPHISKRRSSEDVVPFIDGSRVASVVRSKRGSHSLSSPQLSGMQYRPSYSPYQRISSSPYRRRSHTRQLSSSDVHAPNSSVSLHDSGIYLSPQQLHSRVPLHRQGHVDQFNGSDAPPPSSTVSPHDSGIFLSPQQLHSRTNSFGSVYTPGPPSVSSSGDSQSRETSLGIFHTPVDQGYEVSGGYFPFPSIHPGADKVHDGVSANTLELVIPANPIQLPQPLPVPQIRHPIAYSVGVSPAAPAVTSPWCPKPQQTKEGKLQIDHAMINASFRDTKDPLSAQRRVVLERVLQSIWFQSHELEPKVSGPYDELTGGLGVSGRSVYTCFLKFVTSQEGGSGGSGGKWVCLFGDESHPCPKARWEEGFNKPERAIEHIRSHLGHRPFWCNNECGSNPPCTWKFFANSHRYDHWKKPHKRSHCDVCGESVQAQNLVRHLETHAREDA